MLIASGANAEEWLVASGTNADEPPIANGANDEEMPTANGGNADELPTANGGNADELPIASDISDDERPITSFPGNERCDRLPEPPIPVSSQDHSVPHFWNFYDGMFHSAANGTMTGLAMSKPMNMPKNARQTDEGYWLGAHPTCRQLQTMYASKIRLIVSASSLESPFDDLPPCINSTGFKHIYIPFGSKFPKPSKFIETVRKYRPEQVYIHCEHGGDRSGAVLAFLLSVEKNWPIEQALLAVLFPSMLDFNNLQQIFAEYDISPSPEMIRDYFGIYSGESNFGYGGLKVRSFAYKRLIRTTIETALRFKNSLQK